MGISVYVTAYFFPCLCTDFASLWIFGAAPVHEPPPECEFGLSTWLSPGRPCFLAKECMGVGSLNKRQLSLRAVDNAWLFFSWFTSPVTLNLSVLLLLLLHHFRHNGFTLRLRRKDAEEGRAPQLQLSLIKMPMLGSERFFN